MEIFGLYVFAKIENSSVISCKCFTKRVFLWYWQKMSFIFFFPLFNFHFYIFWILSFPFHDLSPFFLSFLSPWYISCHFLYSFCFIFIGVIIISHAIPTVVTQLKLMTAWQQPAIYPGRELYSFVFYTLYFLFMFMFFSGFESFLPAIPQCIAWHFLPFSLDFLYLFIYLFIFPQCLSFTFVHFSFKCSSIFLFSNSTTAFLDS